MMAAGLRATAKAVEQPPEPNVGAPVLDPTDSLYGGNRLTGRLLGRDAAIHPCFSNNTIKDYEMLNTKRGGFFCIRLFLRMTRLLCAVIVFSSGGQFAHSQTTAPSTYQKVCPKLASGQITCHAVRRTRTQMLDDAVMQNATPAPPGYYPVDLQSAYKYDTSLGKGKTVAIVIEDDDPNAETDLAVYRSYFGLPPCTTANGCFRKINQNGLAAPLPPPDEGWAEEASLQLDIISAVCPNCNLLLVEANSNVTADFGSAVNQAASQGAAAISNPYGSGESRNDPFDTSPADCETYYTHPGVGVVVSAGDAGYGPGFPATCPYVTSVGGTTLVPDGGVRGWSETVWNGTGSGCSAYITKPAYQTDAGCGMRTIADVAAVADPATGVAVYDTYANDEPGWGQYGGTSVGSALIAGIYGLANTHGPKVFPVIFAYESHEALFDVTTGTNGECAVPYLCSAQIGYDGPTGNGTPNGLDAFQPSAFLVSNPNPSTYHQIVTFTAKMTSSAKGSPVPTGVITLTSASQTLGTCTLLTTGAKVAKCKLATSSLGAGENVVAASYSGDNNYPSYSESITQYVGPTGTKTRLKVKPNAPIQGQPTQFEAFVTEVPDRGDAPSGTVTFYNFDLYSNVNVLGTSSLNAGTATLSYVFTDTYMHYIYAAYNGSPEYSASSTATIVLAPIPSSVLSH